MFQIKRAFYKCRYLKNLSTIKKYEIELHFTLTLYPNGNGNISHGNIQQNLIDFHFNINIIFSNFCVSIISTQ